MVCQTTSVDDVVLVEVIDRLEHLSNCLGSVFLSELSLLANAVKQLSTSRQLGNNVVLVLVHVSCQASRQLPVLCVPSTQTSRGT